MHHMLHCDIMNTFIGLDRPSAGPSVVIPSHTAKVTTKNEGSPKHHASTPGPHAQSDLLSSVVKETAEMLATVNATLHRFLGEGQN